MDFASLTDSQRKGLPKNYPLPILRLARLAVDQAGQGKGIALQLIRFVLNMALEQSEKTGCIGVLVDAKPGVVPFYEKLSFSVIEMDKGQSGSRPRPTPLFLGIKVIKKAQ